MKCHRKTIKEMQKDFRTKLNTSTTKMVEIEPPRCPHKTTNFEHEEIN